MKHSDIESFVILKFYPISATTEYANSIPSPIKNKFLDGTTSSTRSPINDFLYLLTMFENSHLEEPFWELLKSDLIEYYENN